MEIWKNNNLLKSYRESLPLEDRDDYAAWKKDYDYKNTSEYKRNKFRNQLNTKRNKSGVEYAWLLFGQKMLDMSDNGIDQSIKSYEYGIEYDDFFEISILNHIYDDVDNVYLIMDSIDRKNHHFNNIHKVIDYMMVSKKVSVSLLFSLTCESLRENGYPWNNSIDLYIKDAIDNGYSRKDVSGTKKFLTNFYKEIKPFINSIEKDLDLSNITEPIFADDIGSEIVFGIKLEIPYNFGVKNNDEKEMTNKARLLVSNLKDIYKYVSPLLLNK